MPKSRREYFFSANFPLPRRGARRRHSSQGCGGGGGLIIKTLDDITQKAVNIRSLLQRLRQDPLLSPCAGRDGERRCVWRGDGARERERGRVLCSFGSFSAFSLRAVSLWSHTGTFFFFISQAPYLLCCVTRKTALNLKSPQLLPLSFCFLSLWWSTSFNQHLKKKKQKSSTTVNFLFSFFLFLFL